MVQRQTTSATRTNSRTTTIGILLLMLVLSIQSLAAQKLTTTQMRENSIRINALEITQYNVDVKSAKEMTIVLDANALSFDFDKSVVKPQYFELLENLKKYIDQNNYEVTITGYTDSKGSEKYNIALSQRRAEAVRDKLIEFGLEADRIVGLVAMGEADPVATNDTEEGKPLFQQQDLEQEYCLRQRHSLRKCL